MFFGETAINLDAKGRLAVPIRYRETLAEQCGNRMVLTYSAFESGSLWLQSEQVWERIRDDVMALPNFKPATGVYRDAWWVAQQPLNRMAMAGF